LQNASINLTCVVTFNYSGMAFLKADFQQLSMKLPGQIDLTKRLKDSVWQDREQVVWKLTVWQVGYEGYLDISYHARYLEGILRTYSFCNGKKNRCESMLRTGTLAG
jgi:hypothetical protein